MKSKSKKFWGSTLAAALAITTIGTSAEAQNIAIGNDGPKMSEAPQSLMEMPAPAPSDEGVGEQAAPEGQRYNGTALLIAQSADCVSIGWNIGSYARVRYHAYDPTPPSGFATETVGIHFNHYTENVAVYGGTLRSTTLVPTTFVGIGFGGGWRTTARARILGLAADPYFARFYLDIWKPNWGCTFQRWRISAVAVSS